MATALPQDVTYGYVADRLLRAVMDTPNDPDHLPDGIPAEGTVSLIPVANLFTAEDGKTGVIGTPYDFKIHQGEAETTEGAPVGAEHKGLLVNPHTGRTGAHAVVAGWYNVAYRVDGYQYQYGPFHITPEHTEENPFWVRENVALEPTPQVRFVINEAILKEVRQIRDDLLENGTSPEEIEQVVRDYLATNPSQVGVLTVNGETPDENGNVTIEVGGDGNVLSVNGLDGEVILDSDNIMGTDPISGQKAPVQLFLESLTNMFYGLSEGVEPLYSGTVLSDGSGRWFNAGGLEMFGPGSAERGLYVGGDEPPSWLRDGDVWISQSVLDGGVSAHSDLSGLDADDHPQYLNEARGDARYALLGHNHPVTDIDASGTRTSSTFLRGDGVWATPPTGGEASVVGGRIFIQQDAPTNPQPGDIHLW